MRDLLEGPQSATYSPHLREVGDRGGASGKSFERCALQVDDGQAVGLIGDLDAIALLQPGIQGSDEHFGIAREVMQHVHTVAINTYQLENRVLIDAVR